MKSDQYMRQRAEIGLRRIRWGVWAGVANIVMISALTVTCFVFEARFARVAVPATGEIIKITPEDHGDRVTFSFVDATGALRSGSAYSPRGSYQLGEKLELLYDPARPALRSQIAGFWGKWVLTFFFGACLVIMICSTLWLRSRRQKIRRRLDATELPSTPP